MGDKTLTLRLKTLQELALAPATKRAYATGSKRYIKFCKQYNITPFPATELTLCYFAAHLSEQCQYATVRLYLSAVRAEHLNRGLEDPLQDAAQLKLLMQGLQKHSQPRTRLPISPQLLQQLVLAILDNPFFCQLDRYLYATVVSITFFGCLRASEVTYPSSDGYDGSRHLTLEDITVQHREIRLRIKYSKADQSGIGAIVVIGPSKQIVCPVKLLKRFLHLRRHAHRTDAAFRLQNGSLLTRSNLLSVLRTTPNSLNMPAEQFGTHSLRIGSATAAAEAGIPIKIIKAMGRWSSDCYRRYIRTPHRTLRHLIQKLCTSQQ